LDYARCQKLVAFVGDDVTLPCSTKHAEPVIWWYEKSEGSSRSHIYDTVVFESYEHRIREQLINASAGIYSLVLTNVTLNDSGHYVCTEKAGQGSRHTIKLNVTGK
jgi:Immunoglobulin domain